MDSYTLALACLLLPAGAIGDRYGRRGALVFGLAIFAAASLVPVFLDSPVQIIIARAVAGVGAAFIMPATLSLLTSAFPKSERNKAVGIWAGVAGSGAVGRDPGNWWAAAVLVMAIDLLGLHIAAAVLFILHVTIVISKEAAKPMDWVGAVVIGGAVAVFVFGVWKRPPAGGRTRWSAAAWPSAWCCRCCSA